ncbi:MAG TPA: pinensin family lanthipeptide [Longimicrobium sp.]|nr:pinensin family lanthipeptide [Longimicrobium sp.]
MPMKLKLNLDALEVASFETVEVGDARGTVHGLSFFTDTETGTGSECNTYDESCVITACNNSKHSSCQSVTFTVNTTTTSG